MNLRILHFALSHSLVTVTFLRSGLTKYKLKFTKDGDNYYMRGTKTGIEAGVSCFFFTISNSR